MKLYPSVLILVVLSIFSLSGFGQKEILYAGTYSQRESQGIYVYEFDRNSNSFELLQTIPNIQDPNFLTVHPSGKFLYVVNTVTDEDGKKMDMISSFRIERENGYLTFINQNPSGGKGACHVSLDKTGKRAFVSHYTSGTLTVFPINNDGSVGNSIQTIEGSGHSVTRRQNGPHIHSSLVSPDNKYVYVADLGADKIMIFLLDQTTGKLSPAAERWVITEPGSGPRHFTFHPSKPFFYLAQEINSTVNVFKWDESTGLLTSIQSLSTLPKEYTGRNLVADIHTTPDSKYLYVSNRGHNSIAIFSIKDDGTLELPDHEPVLGDHPRNFMVDPKGEFLLVANQNTDNVVGFKIDKATGKLDSSEIRLQIPAVVCLKYLFDK